VRPDRAGGGFEKYTFSGKRFAWRGTVPEQVSDAPTVIQTEHLAEEAAAWLGERCMLLRCAPDDPRFSAAVAAADGLVVRTYTTVDADLLDRAAALRVVGRAGAGLDNIDVAACRARGVEVVHTPDANTQAVVEFVIARLGAVLRPAEGLVEAVPPSAWKQLRARRPDRPQMSDMTLGLLGMGRIGRRMALVAAAIGFGRVLYNDLVEIPPQERHGASFEPVERVFEEADVLSIHVDGRAANRGFVAAGLLDRMKPGVIFVNTSRGFVVDSLSLASFLQGHSGAVALLDVHDPEPFDETYPLLGLPNAQLFPHMAASTRQADRNMSWVVRDVVAVLAGRSPRFPAP
jgi:phosphoglycerate dehydrogenase-like enzyme